MKLSSKATLVFLSLFFTGCSSSGLKKEVDQDMGQIRNVQAQHTATLESLASEVRILAGRIEEMEFHARGKTKELEQTLERFSSRVPPPDSVPVALLSKDEGLISAQAGQAAASYRLALKKLRGGDFNGAANGFKKFLEENPETAFSDNALFWLGICQESAGDFGRAIGRYTDVYTRFPAEDFVAPALLQLGKTFAKMGSKQEARDAFSKLQDDFPQSSYAKEAGQQLRLLKRR